MIDLKNKNGFRYGIYSAGGLSQGFPRQAMTTTNWNHLVVIKKPALDMKTKFFGIFCGKTLNELHNEAVFDDEVKKIEDVIRKNPGKKCFLILGKESSSNITKADNEFLLKFQEKAGFHFIKVFFKKNRNADEDFVYFSNKIPKEKYMPVLDMNLNNEVFEDLYARALKKLEIIGFVGRQISKTDTDNKKNFAFIASRDADKIVRIVFGIKKKTSQGKPNSCFYNRLGFDMYVFNVRRSRYHIDAPLEILSKNRFVLLSKHPEIKWHADNTRMVSDTIYDYPNRETVPLSVHSFIELNEGFETLLHTMDTEMITEIDREIGSFISLGKAAHKLQNLEIPLKV